MSRRRMLSWMIPEIICVQIFLGWLYFKYVPGVCLKEFVITMLLCWIGWVFASMCMLIIHEFSQRVKSMCRMSEMLSYDFGKIDDVYECLRYITVKLYWEQSFLETMFVSMTLPLQVVILLTEIMIGTNKVYKVLYSDVYGYYGDYDGISELRAKIEKRYGVALSDNWLYVLRLANHTERSRAGSFKDFVKEKDIILKEEM